MAWGYGGRLAQQPPDEQINVGARYQHKRLWRRRRIRAAAAAAVLFTAGGIIGHFRQARSRRGRRDVSLLAQHYYYWCNFTSSSAADEEGTSCEIKRSGGTVCRGGPIQQGVFSCNSQRCHNHDAESVTSCAIRRRHTNCHGHGCYYYYA